MEAFEILEQIAGEVKTCSRCKLADTRTHAVPGQGPADAAIMLIGEGPGFHEDQQGLPFVGAAGKLLNELLAKGGFERSDVFITNVVKCRPPGNRDPETEELEACSAYLERQIEAMNPVVIVTLGRFSMARYFPDARISGIHGKPSWRGNRLIVPMFHPAAALHQPKYRSSLEEDFSHLAEWVEKAQKKAVNEKSPPREDPPQQLSLF